ncbi:MAG: ornithine--oxo-acid transaminase [Deltaproteobacteria bacterium]|nr:ornithine--oxo-acid transaminase [Deltaproteobacteria bacterium]
MPNGASLIEKAERYGAHNYKPLPVVITRGDGVWVWDVDGKRYMDMLSAYSALSHGHRHPKVIDALIRQAQQLTLTSRAFHNDQLGELAERVCKLSGLDRMLPMNTGAEAVETAIKAARKWGYEVKGVPEGHARIVACTNNFHGRTISVISFSSEAEYRAGFGPFTPGFDLIEFNDTGALETAISDKTVAFIVEPIQGESGIRMPSPGYLKKVRKICDERRVLLILDEVQTGFGRTGKMFCYEHEGIKPDILVMGKALGGGVYPVSAIAGREEVMKVFTPGTHGSTFGGNPLGAAVANAALDALVDEQLTERAAANGRFLLEQARAIESPHVADVRGLGLLIGIDLKPSAGGARRFCEALMHDGLLCKETHETVIRLAPPLIASKTDLEFALSRLRRALA